MNLLSKRLNAVLRLFGNRVNLSLIAVTGGVGTAHQNAIE